MTVTGPGSPQRPRTGRGADRATPSGFPREARACPVGGDCPPVAPSRAARARCPRATGSAGVAGPWNLRVR